MTRTQHTRRIRRTVTVALGLALSLGTSLGACSSDGQSAATSVPSAESARVASSDPLVGLADDVVIPSYDLLDGSFADLSGAVAGLCATPSAGALDAARASWKGAMVAYQRTRAGAVGPADERRLMSAVAFAARPNLIDKLLAGDESVDAEGLRRQGAAVRGLFAVEHALFGEGSEALATPDAARRCQYVEAAVELSSDAVGEVAAEWTDGDARGRFIEGLDGGPQSTVAQLLNEVSRRVNEVDTMGLRDLAAADDPASPDEDRRDGPAGYRLAHQRAILDGVSDVLGDGSTGITAMVAADDQELADRVVAASDEAVAAMADLPDGVAEAFADPEEVDRASDAVAALKVLVSTEVASRLGVTITFSDSDGDA